MPSKSPCLAAFAAFTALAFAPLPALAHAILVDSSPAPEGHIPAGTQTIVLRYNSRIDAGRCKVTMTAPDGTTSRLATHGEGADKLDATTTLTPGAYTLHWQVLAIDGHITRGNVPFTVDASGATSATGAK